MLNNKNFLEKRFTTGFSKTSSGNMAIANDPLSPSFSLNIHGSYSQKTTQGNQLFDASKIAHESIIVSDNGATITMPLAIDGNGVITTNATLQSLCPSLKVGDVAYLYFQRNLGLEYNNYIYLSGEDFIWYEGTSRQITQTDLDNDVYLYGNRFVSGETEQVILTNFIITTNQNSPYEPYTGGEKSPNPNYPSEPTMLGETSVSSNLYNFRDVNTYYNNALGEDVTVDDDGWITIEVDNSTSDTEKFNNFWTNGSPDLKTSTQYSVIMEVKEVSGGGYIAPVSSTVAGFQSQFSTGATYGLNTLSNDTIKIANDTTLDSFVEPITHTSMLRTFLETPAHSTNKIIFRLSVIEDTSVTSDNFVYEPYANIILQQSNKNLLPNNATTQTINGVTFTKNSDGSVTANGTATGDHARYIVGRFDFDSNVDYFMSGCPSNGSNSTYRMDAFLAADGNVSGELSEDFGNGVNIKLPEDAYRDIRIIVFNGATVDNLTFYPMINLGTTVSDYVPHQGNNYYINLDDNLVEAVSSSYYDNLNIDLLGNCKLTKNIAKVIYDGSDDEIWKISQNEPNETNRYSINVPTLTKDFEYQQTWPIICDCFTVYNFDYIYRGDVVGISGYRTPNNVSDNSLLVIGLANNLTVEEFKTWLSTHNTSVWYLLASPQELELPNLDKPITLFEGENIFTVGSNLPTTLDITYQSRAN